MAGFSILGKHMARFRWIETQNRLQIKTTLKCDLFETNQLMIGDVKKILHFNIH
jgi:hypothetical protein